MGIDWQTIGAFWVYALVALLCLGGFLLSCLSLSGTWLVLAATGLVAWMRWPAFPHIGTLVVFLLICIGVEVVVADDDVVGGVVDLLLLLLLFTS